MMKAVLYDTELKNGGPETLHVGEVPMPVAKNDDEVVIKIEATAVNRADILQRQGKYPPQPGVTHVMGLECAGYLNDKRVMALLPGGGYA
eukprot:CAMPEP_0116886456 /NCGR_PEP_ID=MMETSP0463-20121206/20324_1 /TAXON_ID=181622 /ORGANISM="Strombidinopsis sp, Strain SopsisLIS2011" /LENGTH=89 /DNA_ID=CAMNT_0004546931 /DNA_START=30 /DNA_END=299 /DNA_ORIENTATION=-